jgi:hypothetical protein
MAIFLGAEAGPGCSWLTNQDSLGKILKNLKNFKSNVV